MAQRAPTYQIESLEHLGLALFGLSHPGAQECMFARVPTGDIASLTYNGYRADVREASVKIYRRQVMIAKRNTLVDSSAHLSVMQAKMAWRILKRSLRSNAAKPAHKLREVKTKVSQPLRIRFKIGPAPHVRCSILAFRVDDGPSLSPILDSPRSCAR